MVSDGFWRDALGADPGAVGSSILLNDVPYEVIGVMPPDFVPPFVSDAQVWTLFQVDPAQQAGRRGGFSFHGILRLAPDAGLDLARAQASDLGRRLEEQYPESNVDMGFTLRSLQEDLVQSTSKGLWVVMAAVGLLLLVACVNVANLLLSRASSRTGELSIRAAVGAGRRRIVGQLLVESLILAGAGGALGIALGVFGTRGLVALAPQGTPRIESVTVDAPVLLFSALLTVLAGIAFGLAPALRAARSDLQSTLREGGRDRHGGRKGMRVRNALVAAQVAVALVVLVGAGLLVRSFQNLRTVDLGYQPRGVLTFFLNLPVSRYEDGDALRNFMAEAEPRLQALPGVQSVGTVAALPLAGFDGDASFNIEGRPLPQPGREDAAWVRQVTPGYLDAMSLRLVSGRFVERSDVSATPRVLVVNETLAQQHFPDENPIGQRLNFGDPAEPDWWEIVGVVGDIRHFGLREDRRDAVYLPFQQVPTRATFFTLKVADGRDPLAVVPEVRRVLADMDPSLAAQQVQSMAERVSTALDPDRFLALLLTLFAGVTLFLAVVGLYGVISYSVTARLREMGVRLALGAEAGRIGRLVVGHSLTLAIIGVLSGAVLAGVGAPALRSLLYGVGVSDPATFVVGSLVLLAVAVVAAAVPAWRAARVDPVTVLRSE
jgi:putative ABC transport system permease protein